MEVLPYGTLFQFLHESPNPSNPGWDFKVKAALNIAEGMSYLHSQVCNYATTPLYPIQHYNLYNY